jgi:hypothetical protein
MSSSGLPVVFAGSALLELSTAEEPGVALDVGFTDELDRDGLTLELEPGFGATAEELEGCSEPPPMPGSTAELEDALEPPMAELEPGFGAIALELLEVPG